MVNFDRFFIVMNNKKLRKKLKEQEKMLKFSKKFLRSKMDEVNELNEEIFQLKYE